MEQNNNITRSEFNKLEERVRKLEVSSEVNVFQYEEIKKSLGVIQKDVETIKNIPNKRQEDIISKIVTTIVGAIIGAVIAVVSK